MASPSGVVPPVPVVHEPVPELTYRFVCETMPPVETIRVSSGGIHDRLDNRNSHLSGRRGQSGSSTATRAKNPSLNDLSLGDNRSPRSRPGDAPMRRLPCHKPGCHAEIFRDSLSTKPGRGRWRRPTQPDRRPSDRGPTPTGVGGGRSGAGRTGGLMGGRADGDSPDPDRRPVPSRFAPG
jgi:hypothetical protein